MSREFRRNRDDSSSGADGSIYGKSVKKIDRDKTCPFLLRTFIKMGDHNPLDEYSRGRFPSNELQIYTWMDATLDELCKIVKSYDADYRRKGTVFDLQLVIPRRDGGYYFRGIGFLCNGVEGGFDNDTLEECRLTIGDFLDIAIIHTA